MQAIKTGLLFTFTPEFKFNILLYFEMTTQARCLNMWRTSHHNVIYLKDTPFPTYTNSSCNDLRIEAISTCIETKNI